MLATMPAPKRGQDPEPTVFVIDDEEPIRGSLSDLFESIGLRVKSFASVQAFLAQDEVDRPGCLVLDVRLPGQSGLEFFDKVTSEGCTLPVVFISGHADIPMSVRAMKAGAVDFLTKPVRSQDLLDAVQLAIEQDKSHRAAERRLERVRANLQGLTPRERQVLSLIVAGRQNKEIAAEIGLSESTVKLHRGHVMHKMDARSVAELVRMTDALEDTEREPGQRSRRGSLLV